jgi:hypothetical protein
MLIFLQDPGLIRLGNDIDSHSGIPLGEAFDLDVDGDFGMVSIKHFCYVEILISILAYGF